MKNLRSIILTIALTIITVGYTYLVKVYDVAIIGPNETSVGFSKYNSWFRNLVGTNMTLYKVAKYAGIAVLLIAGVYALIGIIQLIKRKSLFKVDREIVSLGILYALVIIVYLFFEKFVINYRPVLIDGVLEPSYPSSHTLLAFTICISSMVVCRKYFSKMVNVVYFITMLLLTLVVLGRTLSGVHWLSDIVGGVLISLNLLMIFYTILRFQILKEEKSSKKK